MFKTLTNVRKLQYTGEIVLKNDIKGIKKKEEFNQRYEIRKVRYFDKDKQLTSKQRLTNHKIRVINISAWRIIFLTEVIVRIVSLIKSSKSIRYPKSN